MIRESDFAIARTNLYEVIAEKIEAMIIDEILTIDEKMPSENQLAVKFGVSRNIVREALKILKERGLIEVKTGDGAYVRKPKTIHLQDVVNRIVLLDSVKISSIYEVRQTLEVQTSGLAALRGSEQEKAELEEILFAMEKSLDNLDRWSELDLQFHCLVAKMTKNALYYSFVKSIANILYSVIKESYSAEDAPVKGLESHRKITNSIKAGDQKLSEEYMKEHLEDSEKNMNLIKNETIRGK